MANSNPPQLPLGEYTSSVLGIQENFSFHQSPESFIWRRFLHFAKPEPSFFKSRPAVAAKLLNRNVAIVTSYSQMKQILCTQSEPSDAEPSFLASASYEQLMTPFFPERNLLLVDGSTHNSMRKPWESEIGSFMNDLKQVVEQISMEHFDDLLEKGDEFGLYESMKVLAWKILLRTFLGLKPEDPDFNTIQYLQEDLLRGQFSTFPVSLDVWFWKSSRKKGIEASKKLNELIKRRLKSSPTNGFMTSTSLIENIEQIADHILLFTSSLAAKALASTFTAFFLNLYLYPRADGNGCLPIIEAAGHDELASSQILRNLILETLRLSPPIVGIMRRSTEDQVLISKQSGRNTLIPKGWDVWLYFVGASRDPMTFGQDCNSFKIDRYDAPDTPYPLAFSIGPKSCLGRDMSCKIVEYVANTCLKKGIQMTGRVDPPGVRAWLGWDESQSQDLETLKAWASDMKQLPTQHPVRPILVRISK